MPIGKKPTVPWYLFRHSKIRGEVPVLAPARRAQATCNVPPGPGFELNWTRTNTGACGTTVSPTEQLPILKLPASSLVTSTEQLTIVQIASVSRTRCALIEQSACCHGPSAPF